MPIIRKQTVDNYILSDIFDPDIHTDVTGITKIVPAIGSIILHPDGVITRVDDLTADDKVVHGPILIKTQSGSSPDELINYGEDKFMLYYDDRLDPIVLSVDGKLAITGSNSVGYRLFKIDPDTQKKVIISTVIDGDGNIVGNLAPIVTSSRNNYLEFTQCNLLTEITDGELVYIEIVNSSGQVIIEAQLEAIRSTVLNNLDKTSSVIVDITADCSQTRGDKWVIYKGQDIEELSINPYLVFEDGESQRIVVDNLSTFLYGFENIDVAFPGLDFDVMIKHFIGKNELSTIAKEENGMRFVILEKTVVIDVKDKYRISKIYPIPIWDVANNRYNMRYIAYYENRQGFTDVTDVLTFVPDYEWDPALRGTQQEVRLRCEYISPENPAANETHEQTLFITVQDPDSVEPILISDTIDGSTFGAQNATHNRPILEYDEGIQKYFVPTGKFPDQAEFLRNFYTMSNPPTVGVEMTPPTPTHFMIRATDPGYRSLTSTPILIGEYDGAFTLNDEFPVLEQKEVIVEFLLENGPGYSLLFGVPVDVVRSVSGYNG